MSLRGFEGDRLSGEPGIGAARQHARVVLPGHHMRRWLPTTPVGRRPSPEPLDGRRRTRFPRIFTTLRRALGDLRVGGADPRPRGGGTFAWRARRSCGKRIEPRAAC